MNIGVYQYNPKSRELSQGEQVTTLPFKTHSVLMALLDEPGVLVSREKLIDEVWDGNFLVGDKALTQAIWTLRKLFDQHDDLIETVPKSGYILHLPSSSIEKSESTEPQQKKQHSMLWPLVAFGLFALPIIAFFMWPEPKPSNNEVAVIWNVTNDNSDAYWQALEKVAEQLDLDLVKQPILSSGSEHNLNLLVQLRGEDESQRLSMTLTSKTPEKMQSRQTTQTHINPELMADELLTLLHAISL
ncbi:hypothetical protein EYS14_21785 [Alteromonadaceae bacterium M269]|nr:hypothetical protein EYS14_21785 [Alteromonadaceae bacterium M269]